MLRVDSGIKMWSPNIVLITHFNPFQSDLREQEMYDFEQMNFNREQ